MGHYAEKKQYQGVVETNETNKQIADDLNATNKWLQQQANIDNVNLAKQQNDWNVEQWNRQNEYNTPANQVKRLVEAGINPALVGGVGNAGNADSAPQSADLANQEAAHLDARPDIRNPYEGFADRQIQRQNAITAQLDSLAGMFQKKAEIAESRQRIAESENRVRVANGQLALAQGINPFQEALLKAQEGFTQKQKENVEFNTQKAMKLLAGDYEQQQLTLNNMDQYNKRQYMENKVYEAQMDELMKMPKIQNQETAKKIALLTQQITKLGVEITGTELANKMTKKELDWFDAHNQATLNKEVADFVSAVQNNRLEEWRHAFINAYGFDPSNSSLWPTLYQQVLRAADNAGFTPFSPTGTGVGVIPATPNGIPNGVNSNPYDLVPWYIRFPSYRNP